MFRGRAGRRPGLIFFFPPLFPSVLLRLHCRPASPWNWRNPQARSTRSTSRTSTILHLKGGRAEVGSHGGQTRKSARALLPYTPRSAAQTDAHILFKCHISFDPGQCFSMCLAQLLPSQPPPHPPRFVFLEHPPPSLVWKAREDDFGSLSPLLPVTQFPRCYVAKESRQKRELFGTSEVLM